MPPASPDMGDRYVAHSAYEAEDESELSLQIGDVIIVVEYDDDGWWLCRNLRTSKEGFTPSNHIDPEAAVKASESAAPPAVRMADVPRDATDTDEPEPTTIKEKIEALRKKSSQEHISSPVDLDGVDELEVFSRKVEFQLLESSSPTDVDPSADTTLAPPSSAAAVSHPPATAAAPSTGSTGAPPAPAQREPAPRADYGGGVAAGTGGLSSGSTSDRAATHPPAAPAITPTAAQLADPVIKISYTKLQNGKLSAEEFAHIIRIQEAMSLHDSDDPAADSRDPSAIQMSPLGAVATAGARPPSQHEYELASGADVSVSSGVGAGADLDLARSERDALASTLAETKAALASEREARDADNAASAASLARLESALADAQAAPTAATSAASADASRADRAEAELREVRRALAEAEAGRRGESAAAAAATARAEAQAASAAELRAELAELRGTLASLEASLKAAADREARAAVELQALESERQRATETVEAHAATIVALKAEAGRAGAKGGAEAKGSVVDEELSAAMPRSSPLLQNPQRAKPPPGRTPSTRTTYKDAVSLRESGSKPDLFSTEPVEAAPSQPRPAQSSNHTPTNGHPGTAAATAAPRDLQAAFLEVRKQAVGTAAPKSATTAPKKRGGKRRLPAIPKK